VTVLRVEGTEHLTTDDAVRIVAEAWGVPRLRGAVLGQHSITWDRAATGSGAADTEHPACVIARVGEQASGPGIAAVIESTIATVARLAPEPPPATLNRGV
jgi:hypothetical protein